MAWFAANAAFLVEKRRTNHLSGRTGLVLDEMIRIVGDRKTSVVANLAEWHVGGTLISIGEDLVCLESTCRCRCSCTCLLHI